MALRRFLLLCTILAQVLSNRIEILGEPSRARLTHWPNSETIPDFYFVSLHESRNYTIDDHWRTIGQDLSSSPGFTNLHLFFAYIAKLNAMTLDLVRQDPGVHFVEADARLAVSLGDDWKADSRAFARNDTWDLESTIDTENLDCRADNDGDVDMNCQDAPPRDWTMLTQYGPPWQLEYIAALDKLSPLYPQAPYRFMKGGGRGVDIYVIDTGINPTNRYLEGRVTNFHGVSLTDASPYIDPPEPMYDTVGHGTAIAGLLGANYLGVARGANIISVKVLTGSRRDISAVLSSMLRAWHDVILAHIRKCELSNGEDMSFRGSVISASFTISFVAKWLTVDEASSLLAATKWARYYGMQIVVGPQNVKLPAGYPNFDWPCVSPDTICVASINSDYSRQVRSVYGPEVDFLAPGVSMLTTSWAGGYQLAKKSGNSFAAPLAAGVAAIFVSWKGLACGDVRPYLRLNALEGVCSGVPDDQANRLINTGIMSPAKDADEPFIGASRHPAPRNVQCRVHSGLLAVGGPHNPRPLQ